MARVIPLGGRFFSVAEQTTVRQDGWTMAQVEDAGLLDLLYTETLSDEARARQLVVRAMRSGRYCNIAAGLLVEVDQKWSVESAEKNAEAFGELTSSEDKTALLGAFAEALTRFFLSGMIGLAPLPTASMTGPVEAPPPKARRESMTDVLVGSGPTQSDGSLTPIASASS